MARTFTFREGGLASVGTEKGIMYAQSGPETVSIVSGDNVTMAENPNVQPAAAPQMDFIPTTPNL